MKARYQDGQHGRQYDGDPGPDEKQGPTRRPDDAERDNDEQHRKVQEMRESGQVLGPGMFQLCGYGTGRERLLGERRSRMKYSRVIVLPSTNSKAKRATMPASQGVLRKSQPPKNRPRPRREQEDCAGNHDAVIEHRDIADRLRELRQCAHLP